MAKYHRLVCTFLYHLCKLGIEFLICKNVLFTEGVVRLSLFTETIKQNTSKKS